MRLQFYPSSQLEECLSAEAARRSISQSALVVSILEEYYKLSPDLPPFTQLVDIICSEVEAFISTVEDVNYEFPLSEASPTYRSIPMTANGKPNPLRMRIGKAFNKQTVSGRFKGSIEQVFLANGKPKRTNENRAALFVIRNNKKDTL